jgi:CubicO group peptidase (beta-lactamase class C family)
MSDHPLAKVLMDPTSMQFKAFMMSADAMTNREAMNTREWRAAEIPSANGHTNARSLARLYGALANDGELDGVRILQPETIANATIEKSYGEDAVLFMPSRIALGYWLDIPEMQISPTGAIFGHAGAGGSFGYADPVARMGIGYTMNRMLLPPDAVDPRWKPMVDAAYAGI